MSGRADALRALIERVGAGDVNPYEFEPWEAALGYEMTSPQEVSRFMDSLDAVARLEAPLRERGWSSDIVNFVVGGCAVKQWPPAAPEADMMGNPQWGHAPTEARARLVAVLRALLHEAEAEQ